MNHLRRPGLSRAERHGKAATVSRSSGVHEVHDLSDRFGYTWLAAWSRVQLGTLDVAGGQLAEARALPDEALDLSLAIHINRNIWRCAWSRSPGWRSRRAARSWRRCWPGRPQASGSGSAAGVAGAATRGGRSGGPGPPGAGRGPVRRGIRRGFPAQPAGGRGRHPGPAPHRRPGALAHGLACPARHRHGRPDLLPPGSPGHLWPKLPCTSPRAASIGAGLAAAILGSAAVTLMMGCPVFAHFAGYAKPTRFLAVRGLCLLATGLVALPLASAIPPPSPCCSPRRSPPSHGLVFPGGLTSASCTGARPIPPQPTRGPRRPPRHMRRTHRHTTAVEA